MADLSLSSRRAPGAVGAGAGALAVDLPHARQGGGQGHVGAFERGLVAVQDGHEVDHSVVPWQQAAQAGFVVHVGLDHGQARQVLHRCCVEGAPCGHRAAPALALDFFADMATDEAGAAEDEDVVQGSSLWMAFGSSAGPTTPMRARSDCGWPVIRAA